MNTNDLQNRLMPFLIIVISLLAVVYLVFFFLETNEIQNALSKPPAFQENLTLKPLNLNEKKWDNLYTLEKFALSNRYHHATLIVRSRILIISLSFLTGITLSIIGAIFILSKYSEKGTEIGGGNSTLNIKLISSSPGIILSFLGVVLIAISIFSKTDLNVVDSPLYVVSPPTDTVFKVDISKTAISPETKKTYPVKPQKKKKLDDFLK